MLHDEVNMKKGKLIYKHNQSLHFAGIAILRNNHFWNVLIFIYDISFLFGSKKSSHARLFLPLEIPIVNHLFKVNIAQMIGLMSFAVYVLIKVMLIEGVTQSENSISLSLGHLTQSALNK